MSDRRILVIDDERHIARLLEINLQRQGFLVKTAFRLQEARKLLAEKVYEAMVLDSSMPDGDADGFMREVQEDPRHASMKIVRLGDDDIPNGPPPGGLSLTKPFNPMLIGDFLG
ncbi:response regulator [bacterium]|nr:MAG: response regulator [bacterium]